MMAWFRRHLNWAAVFVPVVSGTISIAIVRIILLVTGMPHVPFPDYPYPFDIQATVAITDVFSIVCFGWILKKKNRSFWYLVFFVPPLVVTLASLLAWVALVSLMTFWLWGWIIVLVLKNKSGQHVGQQPKLCVRSS